MGGEEGLGVTTGQPNLYKQDLSQLDVNKLTALSCEVISRQATINIGTIGHVAHGKSTIVKAISGVQTVRFKNELERNITIKLEAHDAECVNGERADIPDETTEMPTIYGKRSLSPGSANSSSKLPKLNADQSACNLINYQDDETVKKDLSKQNNVIEKLTEEKTFGILKEHIQIENDNMSDKSCSTVSVKIDDIDQSKTLNIKDVQKSDEVHYDKDIKLRQCWVILEKMLNEWEIESILKKKYRNGVLSYLIKWKNWSSKYNTWEPVQNLDNCGEMLKKFEKKVKLLEKFQAVTKFKPTLQEVELYLESIKNKGESIDCIPIKEELLYTDLKNYFRNKSIRNNNKLEKDIKKNILRKMLCDMRSDQLESLREWEKEMNVITQGKPIITVENVVDLEVAPQNFCYIQNYLPGSNVTIPEDPPIGCECTKCGSKSKCCYLQFDTTLSYTVTSRVCVPPGTPIYECNKRCKCKETCQNRVVQRGSNNELCIFRTNNGTGWGVKTLQAIKKGSFVTQYVGEVITNEEAEKRGKEYDAAGRTYLFDLDYNSIDDECPYTVDAAVYGNVSHFINHSCDPNLAVYGVWINCLDPNLPTLALFATRNIKENEEITFDYMCQISQRQSNIQNLAQTNFVTSEPRLRLQTQNKSSESEQSTNKMLCKCGAENCRQYLF